MNAIPGMSVPSTPTDDLNARLLAQMDEEDKKAGSRGGDFFSFKTVGVFLVRVLPSRRWPEDIVWYRSMGRHGFKPNGSDKHVMFGCVDHAFGQPCPVCAAQKRDKDSPDPELAALADKAYASRRYVLNLQVFDMTTRQFSPVMVAELSKTQFDKFKPVLRMVSPRFMDPEVGHVLHVSVQPRKQGPGYDIEVIKAEGPHNSNLTPADLFDLDEVVKDEYSRMKAAHLFTGDFKHPLPMQQQGHTALPGASAGGMAGIGIPGLGAPAPAALPGLGAPAAAYTPGVPGMATVAQQPVAQQPVAQPVVQQPAQPVIDVAYAAVAQPAVAQPAAQPPVIDVPWTQAPAQPVAQPVAQPAAVDLTAGMPMTQQVPQPVAQPAAPAQAPQLTTSDAEDLEAKLMALVQGQQG